MAEAFVLATLVARRGDEAAVRVEDVILVGGAGFEREQRRVALEESLARRDERGVRRAGLSAARRDGAQELLREPREALFRRDGVPGRADFRGRDAAAESGIEERGTDGERRDSRHRRARGP